jgi:L-ascorbate metabolism protein UlaG (beta-lactamase superfamily)
MIVTYFGEGCFRLQSGDTSILIDPEGNRLKADVVLKTLIATAHEAVAEESSADIIAFPGEYEMKGIEITGFPLTEESSEKFLKTAYIVHWEDMSFVFLGHCSRPLPASLMEEFFEADILFVPAGGGHYLEPDVAAKMVKQLEARVVIPSFTKDPAELLKALGKKADPIEKFVFKQKDIAGDKGRPVILKES